MFQKLPHISPSFWIKLCFVLIFGLYNSVYAQNYVDISLKEIDNSTGELVCPPKNGFVQDLVIAPNSGLSGKGIGWGANLYLKSEAGGPNTIFDLIWLIKSNMTYVGTIYTFDNLDIWMYEYSGVSFPSFARPDVQAWSSGTPPSGVSNLVKVVSKGKLVVKDAGSECITSNDKPFDVPYNYSGNNSLVIYLEKSTPAIVSTGSTGANPVYEHNTRESSTRRLCNWEGTVLNPLNPTAINNAKNKFARVVFNSSHTNTPINESCSTTKFLNNCIPVICVATGVTPSATSVCKSGSDITFTKTPSNVAGTFTSTSGLIIDATNGTINVTQSSPATYTVTFTEAATASCKITKSITINPKPIVANITEPVCSGITFNVTPVANTLNTNVIPLGTKYTWSVPTPLTSGATIQNTPQTSISQTLTNITNAPISIVYKVKAISGTSPNECTTDFDLTVTVKPAPKIDNIVKSICSGQKFDTIPSASATNIIPNSTNYTWTVTNNANITANATSIPDETLGKSSISSTLELINASNTSKSVVYNVTATSGETPNQCQSTFNVTITVKPKPAAPTFTITAQPKCNALGFAEVSVSSFSPPSTDYKFTPSSKISMDAAGKISAESGNYSIVVTKDGCSSDPSSTLTMNDVPGKPVLSGADTICMGTNLTLQAWTDNTKTTVSTPNATNPWVSSDATIATVSNLGFVTSLNKSGKVRITYTDNANCTQFDSIVVASKAVSGTTSFTVDTICESISKSIVLSGFTPSYTIQWQDSIAGSGVWNDIPNETSATFNTPTSLSPGNYFYRALVKNTFCSDNAISKLVKVVVTSKSAPTFTNTDIIQPTCLVATGGVKSNMQYKGVWTIKATAVPLSTGVSKDTTGTVNVIPYALSLNGLNPGKYIFQVTNSKGCTSNPSSEIDIKTQPTIPAKPVLDADTIYCASNSYTLDKIVFKPKPNLSASESIKYYDKNGVVITNPKLVTVIPNESYTFVFNNAYCDSKDKLTTIIPFDNGPALPLSGGDILLTNICAFEKPNFNTLFAKIPGIDTTQFKFYITPDKSIIPISILPNTTIIGYNGGSLQTMFYTLADKKNGCKNNVFAKLTFTLDEGPTGLTLKPKQIFCEASGPTVANLDITKLTPSNATSSLVWYATFGATNSLSASTNLVSMTYFAALKENGGCESIDRKSVLVDIQIFGQTTLDLSNISFCKGSNKTFADLSITPYSYPNFVWLDAYKVVQQPTTKLIPGKYFAAETKNGCVSDKSQEIEVKFESPIISIAPTKLPTCGVGNGALKVVGGLTGYTYKWSKNATPMTDIGDQIFNLPFDYTIKYSVIVEDTKGCKAYDTTQFSDCEPPGIPHVLTLNKDGKNDVFKLHYDTKYPKCKLSIFNRWGSMVYESKDIPYKDDWDGKPNAAGTLGSGELPTGTYFYLIDKGDGSALESGYIELVK